jgi:hypothetical protein
VLPAGNAPSRVTNPRPFLKSERPMIRVFIDVPASCPCTQVVHPTINNPKITAGAHNIFPYFPWKIAIPISPFSTKGEDRA